MLFSVNSFLSFASLSVFGNIVVSYASPLPESQLSIQALSEAIAVGFDLTVDYGTASVVFSDGTFYDAVKIDGEDDYKAMMRRLVDAALDQQNASPYGRFYSEKPSLKTAEPSQERQRFPLDAGARKLQASRWREHPNQSCDCSDSTTGSSSAPFHHSDECSCDFHPVADIHTLSSMIRHLRARVEHRLSAHLPAVAVSIPTVTTLQAATVNAALALAGLQNAHPNKVALSAASAALVNTDVLLHVADKFSVPNILILEYQPFALVSTLGSDNTGPSSPAMLDEAAGSIARHSHTFCSEWGYWRYVRDAMSRLAKKFPDTPVDVVVAIGDAANDRDFVKNAKDATESFPEGLLRKPQVIYQRPLFSAARGAASFAKKAVEEVDVVVKADEVVESEDAEERSTELR